MQASTLAYDLNNIATSQVGPPTAQHSCAALPATGVPGSRSVHATVRLVELPDEPRVQPASFSQRQLGGRLVHLLATEQTALLAWSSLAVITLAEVITTLFDPTVGVVLYGIILLALMAQAALTWEQPVHRLLLALTFAPLIRILSVAMPLAKFPLIYWYLITSIPLFAAAIVIVKVLGFSWASLGINRKNLLLQVPIMATGFVLGFTEYLILRPHPLTTGLTLEQLWLPALILLVCTGFAEELFFRGVLQKAATTALGGSGLIYVAILFAILHIGYKSVLDLVFVLVVGLLFGWFVKKTGSIAGVTFAHGLTNSLLFLVMPFLWVVGS